MRRTLPAFSLSALLALGLAACSGEPAAGGPGGAAAGGPPGGMQLPVEAVTVTAQPLEAGLNTVGSLRADEAVTVRPEVSGRISRIHFEEGSAVRAGEPLFSLDASVQRAALNEALANLENSRRAAARAEDLVDEQLIARADYDTLQAQLAVDQARVASARAALSKMTLRAPFAGQVGLRQVSVGEYVNAGQDLVTLVRLDPIEVDFSVPETVIRRIRPGQPVTVRVDAFPNETFGGEVVAIAPVVDVDSRSLSMRARIANPDFKLRPGQFARVELQPPGDDKALLIPEQALMQDGDVRYVYTIVDGKAHKTPIETGMRVPGKIEVVKGLAAGDKVITAGQSKPMMHEGLPVMVLPTGPGKQPPGEDKQSPGGGMPGQGAAQDKAPPKQQQSAPPEATSE